jgi:hypothetical protein
VVRIKYKNKFSEVYKIDFEEIDGMYEIVYGDDYNND